MTGALISLARGALGWFGPLAVHSDAQRSGVGQQLVAACLASWRRRGVRLMGLETFADSGFHVHFYGNMGLRPGRMAISFSVQPGPTEMPAGVQAGGRQHGKTAVLARTSGSSRATIHALGERGYRAGGVMVRMKPTTTGRTPTTSTTG